MSEIALPPPAVRCGDYAGPPGEGASEDYFTAEQVRHLIAAERERCAKVCEDLGARDWFEVGAVVRAATRECAAAIRKG